MTTWLGNTELSKASADIRDPFVQGQSANSFLSATLKYSSLPRQPENLQEAPEYAAKPYDTHVAHLLENKRARHSGDVQREGLRCCQRITAEI